MSPRTLAAAVPAGAFLVTLFVVCSWTIPGEGNRFAAALWAAVREGGVAVVWWAGAAGLGLWLVRTLLGAHPRTSGDDLALALASGAAAMLVLASALGSMGLLTAAGGIVNWVVVGAGVFLLVRTLRDAPLLKDSLLKDPLLKDPLLKDPLLKDPLLKDPTPADRWSTLIGPAARLALVALFVAAAASAPGWLWSSEFGGFDALSYHLELPKEWIMGGLPVGPVEGNVYSALPSFVEAAFAQVMLMRGAIVEGAVSCQYWSMLAALATAWTVERLARRVVGAEGGIVAFLVFLSLPWVLVVGTLAYNDMAPCLMLAGAWLVIERFAREDGADTPPALDARPAGLLALLAAAAVGAKPTAFLFVALPLLALVAMRCGPRTLRFAPLVVAVALVSLSPWLIRNHLAYGNALFPFAHTILGNGPWSDEQFALFAKGHGPGVPFDQRLPLLWSQWLAHGTGEPPAPGEPWFPQWGFVPIAGLVGLAIAAIGSRAARAALVAIALALLGWLFFTHLKSRFLLPTAVPLSIGAAMLLVRVSRISQQAAVPLLLTPALILPFLVFWREPAKETRTGPESEPMRLQAPSLFIGDATFWTGERFARDIERATPEERAQLAAAAPTAYFINYALPKDARVVAVGFSTPFYLGRPIAWNTVWDRGPLDRVADLSPGTPAVWGAKLRELGYTHVLINPTMLVVWRTAGWMNPALEPNRWLTAFLQAYPSIRTSDGSFIVELWAEPAAQPAPAAAQPAPAAAQPAPAAAQPAPAAAPAPLEARPPSAS